jgi:hypothetical protein
LDIPPIQRGAALELGVGITAFLQMMSQYGSSLESVAVALKASRAPVFVGVVVAEAVSSRAKKPALNVGGVLSTVTDVLTLSALASGMKTSKYARNVVVERTAPVSTAKSVTFPAVISALFSQRKQARIRFGIVQNNLITHRLFTFVRVGISIVKI